MWYAFHWSCDISCDFLVLMWLSGLNHWARVMSEIISSGSRTGTFFRASSEKSNQIGEFCEKLRICEKWNWSGNSRKKKFWKKSVLKRKKGSNKKSSEQKINSGFDFHGFRFWIYFPGSHTNDKKDHMDTQDHPFFHPNFCSPRWLITKKSIRTSTNFGDLLIRPENWIDWKTQNRKIGKTEKLMFGSSDWSEDKSIFCWVII